MKKYLAAAVALAAFGGSAQAATFVFVPGSDALLPTETITYDFNSAANDGSVTGTNFIFQSGTNSQGAAPGAGDNSRYLSVLTDGVANIDFGSAGLSSFSIDIGSLDSFNTLTLQFADGTTQAFTGTELVAGPADGNQVEDRTNGRFRFTSTAGERITGLILASANNAFEVDNIATTAAAPVPEPATWAMMIAGFGLVGGVARRRSRTASLLA
ncbi:hypothetical protein GGR88_001213 [Sphingomonas jejuensis]|uniref:Ice-binding protein C-terminal domain-containing protein n=1 Tax=Sphingomonas jejuensis TaxID=904715 RepID=A0ABX0XKI7_9SPHN|nr:PEPxxWA-CTERM sorting domain-containing protein [Sphingomonas jejuensis]NJC33739.1 hypothetical protein [Sphingomonas jejuensis]